MSNSPAGSAQLNPMEAAIGLLKPSNEAPPTQSGYIDTLGSLDALGPYALHQVCNNKMLPRIYERWWRPMAARLAFGAGGWKGAEEQQIVLDALRLSAGDRVVDVACGPGNYTRPFGGLVDGGLAVGLDASAEMLEAAVEKGGANVVYLRGSGTSLPFEDNSFDAACCLGALHMFDEPVKALGEMNRVLMPGGRLAVLTTYNPKDKETLLSRVRGLRMFGRDEVTDALVNYGLVDVRQRVMGRGQFVSGRRPTN